MNPLLHILSPVSTRIRRQIICILLLWVFAPSDAMDDSDGDSSRRFPRPSFYTLSYAGNNAWNPGAVFDSGFLLQKSLKTRGNETVLLRQLYFHSTLGFYLDPGSHAAYYSQYGFSYLRSGSKGWFRSLELLPAGIYRSFLSETWIVEEGNAARKVFLPGRYYFSPGMSYHVGRHHSDDKERGWFAGMGMTLLIPYNTYVMPLFTVELGWRFSGRKETK